MDRERIVVRIKDVDLVNRAAHCEDKTGGRVMCSFSQVGTAFRIPNINELWTVERQGYIWYLMTRIDTASEQTALQALSPGDTRLQSGGKLVFTVAGMQFNGQPVGATVYDAFTGNSVQTDFALTAAPISGSTVQVYVNGAHKPPSTYTVTGQHVVFNVAPANASVIIIYYQRV